MPIPTDIILIEFIDGEQTHIETTSPSPNLVNEGQDYCWYVKGKGFVTYPRINVRSYLTLDADAKRGYQTGPGHFVIPKALYKNGQHLLLKANSEVVYLNGPEELPGEIGYEARVDVTGMTYLPNKTGTKAEWHYEVGIVNEGSYPRHYGDVVETLDKQSISETQYFLVPESALTTIPPWHLTMPKASHYQGEFFWAYNNGKKEEQFKFSPDLGAISITGAVYIVDYEENRTEWWYTFQLWDFLKNEVKPQTFITRGQSIKPY